MCKAYNEKGHKVGDPHCKAKPAENILAFRSYEHCLSNHFPIQLHVFEEDFASVEHAYFWCMAKEFGNHDLATEIKKSKHAGQAKKLSKQIADDEERWEWEKDHIDMMKTILEAKADQCTQFHDCLIENQERLLVEANPGTFWASGLSLYVTQNCSPRFWPGQNMLGVLLTELTQILLRKEEEVTNDTECSESDEDEVEVTDNEKNENTGESQEIVNEMEVVSQETTESQEVVVNQDPSVSVKSLESHLPTVSHQSVESSVSVDSEVTASAQNSVTQVGPSHGHVSHALTLSSSTAQHPHNDHPRNDQLMSAKKHSMGTETKPKKKKGGKKKKELDSKTVSTTTPRQTGIKKAFEMSRKREAVSSPEDQNESKSQRHEGTSL